MSHADNPTLLKPYSLTHIGIDEGVQAKTSLVVIGTCMHNSDQLPSVLSWQSIAPGKLGSLVMFMQCDCCTSRQPGLKYTCKASTACWCQVPEVVTSSRHSVP